MHDGFETSTTALTTAQTKLQESLDQYSFRMHEHFLGVIKIKAALLEEEQALDPNFNATIIEAQADYNSILQGVLTETVKSAKTVHDLAGAAGLVIGFIETSINSSSKAAEVQKRVSTTLATQEAQAPLIKKQQLQNMYDQITVHENAMDMLLSAFIDHIDIFSSENTQAVKEQVSDAYRECLRLSQNIKKEVQAALQQIDEHLASSALDIERALPRAIMSIHLTRGLISASVAGPEAPLVQIGHYFRKTRVRRAYLDSTLYRLSSLHEPTPFEWACLRAVLKRHPIEDFNPANPGYFPFVKELQMTLYLTGKSERTLCENINLCLSLALNKADKEASSTAALNQQLAIQRGFFSKSPYANNKHFAVRDTLASHLTYTKYELDKQGHITKLQEMSTRIIEFYVTHLTQQFLEHPLFHDWVETHRNSDGEKELLELVVKIINNELGDKTPSDYYKSFLCGMSLFCNAIGKRGTMQLEFDSDARLTLNFSGCLTMSGEVVKQEIIYPGIRAIPSDLMATSWV